MTSQFNPYVGLSYPELCGQRKDYAKLLHAAQAARNLANRNLTLIMEAMNGAQEAQQFEASDHAVVRYLERVEGVDVTAIRETIQMNCEQGEAIIGEKLRGQDGFLYCVNNDGFVTTVLPIGAVVDEMTEMNRGNAERPKHSGKRRRGVRARKEWIASVDTHPQGGDVQQAPSLMGSAVPQADAQTKSVNP